MPNYRTIEVETPTHRPQSLNFADACTWLGVGQPWMRKALANGTAPAHWRAGRLYRFDTDDLQAFKASTRVEAQK